MKKYTVTFTNDERVLLKEITSMGKLIHRKA